MGVTVTLRILLTVFLSTACIQKVRLFGVYDVRWPFLAEIHTVPLKRFVPSSVLQAIRALRNAPAALVVFLAGVAPVMLMTNCVRGVVERKHWFSLNINSPVSNKDIHILHDNSTSTEFHRVPWMFVCPQSFIYKNVVLYNKANAVVK